MPKNASVNGDGFRIYPWPGGDTELNREFGATEAMDLLSVTSIKTLAGEPWRLVNWKINNVVDLAMGVRKTIVIGPRGGVSEKYVPDGPHPGEFVARMLESRGTQKGRDDLRRWIKEEATNPSGIAAVRGSVVHKLIEDRIPANLVTRDLAEKRMAAQWAQERKRKHPPAFIEDDFNFVLNAMKNYEEMRVRVPFVVIAQEPQLYNLTAGYGGSADVILWFLGNWRRGPDGVFFEPLPDVDSDSLQKRADRGQITAEQIIAIGGQVAVGDWKTSKAVYTNHVTQTTAYMAAEFIALDYIIDRRLSYILALAKLGMVIHIRPDHWEVDLFELRQDVLAGFMGSVRYSRFLAMNQDPYPLFVYSLRGNAPEIEGASYMDNDGD